MRSTIRRPCCTGERSRSREPDGLFPTEASLLAGLADTDRVGAWLPFSLTVVAVLPLSGTVGASLPITFSVVAVLPPFDLDLAGPFPTEAELSAGLADPDRVGASLPFNFTVVTVLPPFEAFFPPVTDTALAAGVGGHGGIFDHGS